LLTAELNQALLDYAARLEGEASPSLTSKSASLMSKRASLIGKGRPGVRSGGEVNPRLRVSDTIPLSKGFRSTLQRSFDSAVPEILAGFGRDGFKPSATEIEMVAHRSGAFFGRHVDTQGVGVSPNRSADRSRRVLSAVYYFFVTPRPFVGGELRIHGTDGQGRSTHVDIEPENNRMVAFPSHVPHEVLPVWVSSGMWSDSRFAVNYWLYG
jgi:predicted 2-oxoglutarate/Fe(II)-dependent dioxygenase YbiX